MVHERFSPIRCSRSARNLKFNTIVDWYFNNIHLNIRFFNFLNCYQGHESNVLRHAGQDRISNGNQFPASSQRSMKYSKELISPYIHKKTIQMRSHNYTRSSVNSREICCYCKNWGTSALRQAGELFHSCELKLVQDQSATYDKGGFLGFWQLSTNINCC